MKKRNLSAIAVLLAAALLAFAGCSSDENPVTTAGTATDDYDRLDFSDPYGGLTVSDEDEAFGDDALLAMLLSEDGEEIEDPTADDPDVCRWEDMGRTPGSNDEANRPRFTYLRLRWGMLRGPEDSVRVDAPCDLQDWTGSIRVDRGKVVVKRVIRFERPADHVIFPRLDHQTVAFVSHTRCGFDGLLLQIIEPPVARADSSGVDAVPEPNMLRIDTPLLQAEVDVADLAGMHRVVDVDDLGNRFELTGFTMRDIEVCPKGFLSGRYRFVSPDADLDRLSSEGEHLGNLAGAWYGLDGRIDAFMRGGYGLDADGNRVFCAKVIGRRGHFRGRVAGTWEPADRNNELATFTGHWSTASGAFEGVLGGEAHPVEDYAGGFFVGRWAALCDEEAEALVLD